MSVEGGGREKEEKVIAPLRLPQSLATSLPGSSSIRSPAPRLADTLVGVKEGASTEPTASSVWLQDRLWRGHPGWLAAALPRGNFNCSHTEK